MKVIVKYACEGERPTILDLNTLIENLTVTAPEVDVDDLAGAIDMWGGYQGEHEHGRFVVVRIDHADLATISKLLADT